MIHETPDTPVTRAFFACGTALEPLSSEDQTEVVRLLIADTLESWAFLEPGRLVGAVAGWHFRDHGRTPVEACAHPVCAALTAAQAAAREVAA